MTVFSQKLGRLSETVSMVAQRRVVDLVEGMRRSRGRTVVAVGSGGSAIAAEYLAHCRATLNAGHTVVLTPMGLVMSAADWEGCDIWLFSAGASNPDIAAAFRTAVSSKAEAVRLVTVRHDGATTLQADAHPRAVAHVLPVADVKDGFLSTHSLVSMVAGLLFASDSLADGHGGARLIETLLEGATSALDAAGAGAEATAGFRPGDTIVLLHDPQISTVGVLLETSLWETGIAPVQRTDFRNFAHGRHVWAARHPSSMFVLALTSVDSAAVWEPIAAALPAEVRRGVLGLGNAGRFRNAIGVFEGFAIIRALGEAVGIDPGRPGHGEFARPIYENTALHTLSKRSGAVRHKASARLLYDGLGESLDALHAVDRDRLASIAGTRFAGVALDYDGTIVSTNNRYEQPEAALLGELVRLVEQGVRVGIATGRGGSAGEMLRDVLPAYVHPSITMGYYNGAYIRTLDVDIRQEPPEEDPSLAALAAWIEGEGILRPGARVTRGKLQLTIDHTLIVDREAFRHVLGECQEVTQGIVKMLSSRHSFDIVSSRTSKLKLIAALAERAGSVDAAVLRIGDSGAPGGNDHEMLTSPHGVSVDAVCGSDKGCWSFFGGTSTGPTALLRILRAIKPDGSHFTLDVGTLES